MGVKVAATCLHWSQPVVSSSPSCSHTLPSSISSPSSRRRSGSGSGSDRALVCRFVHRPDRSALFGTTSTKLLRSRSFDNPKSDGQTLRRASSANLDGFSDEEFAETIQELARRLHLSNDDDNDDDDNNNNATKSELEIVADSRDKKGESSSNCYSSFKIDFSKINSSINYVHNPRPFPPLKMNSLEPPWLVMWPDPPDWPEIDEIIPESIERKANSVDLPLSLRIIKRKKQWQEGFKEAGESAYSSVMKAFSSMVFIIRELHSYALQMREMLFFEDLQGILVRVQKEMHASFVWLFQQIFSHTPTLMVYVMILLANFTVYSIASNTAIAAPLPTEYYASATEIVSVTENQNQQQQPKFDSSAIKSFSVSSSAGKTTSVGGNNGGGGKVRPVASGTDGGDGRFDGSSSFNNHRTILPDEISQLSSIGNPTTSKEDEWGVESESQGVATEEEMKLWNLIVEEASRMVLRDEALDHEMMQQFVSPATVEIEPEDYSDYLRTELLYRLAVSQEPDNSLLLSNFAQFLYLVVHDHDRAEEYFKLAIQIKPPDAEALSRYANFLWLARKDLGAAEETYLEAIEADPGNTYHAANYAHFLWNTGGEDTCYPLSSPNNEV